MLMQFDKDINSVLFDKRANGFVKPRIHTALRTRADVFFKRPLGASVDNWDRYQDLADFKNDLKKMMLIPFACMHLSTRHLSNVQLDVISLVLDTLFFDLELSKKNQLSGDFKSIIYEVCASIGYQCLMAVYLVDALIDVSVRASLSLASELIDSIKYAIDCVMQKHKGDDAEYINIIPVAVPM